MYIMQICFGFKIFFFFLRPNLEFWPVFTVAPEIFSKWNRNTLDKVPGVATGNHIINIHPSELLSTKTKESRINES